MQALMKHRIYSGRASTFLCTRSLTIDDYRFNFAFGSSLAGFQVCESSLFRWTFRRTGTRKLFVLVVDTWERVACWWLVVALIIQWKLYFVRSIKSILDCNKFWGFNRETIFFSVSINIYLNLQNSFFERRNFISLVRDDLNVFERNKLDIVKAKAAINVNFYSSVYKIL